MAAAIVFRGKKQVVDAYRANGVGPFAIWVGNVIMYSSPPLDNDDTDQGAAILSKFLANLEEGGSESRFCLAMYKLSDPDEDITKRTEIYRGFMFALYDNDSLSTGSPARQAYSQMNDRIARIEKTVLQEEGDGQEDKSIGAVIAGIIDSVPGLKEAVAMGAAGLVQKMFNMNSQPAQPAQVAGTSSIPQPLPADQIHKINQALEVLSKRDPLLGDHLLAMAKMSEQKYKMALTFL